MSVVLILAITVFGVVALCVVASHAFHSWLRQRERERLSATDRAALEKRLDAVEAKHLELRNTVSSGPVLRR